MGDGGHWLRRQCLVMARNGYGSVQFWLSMPLVEFPKWIEENNRMVEEERK